MKYLLFLGLAFVAKAIDTTEDAVSCDNTDEENYAVEPIGESTQFRIYDLCDDKFIKIKMSGLTEMDTSGAEPKKTNNKVTTFASSKGWEWGEGSGEVKDPCPSDTVTEGACIYNSFVADTIQSMDGVIVIIDTIFAVDPLVIDVIEELASTTGEPVEKTVAAGSVKMNVEINGWPYLAADNELELCFDISTNKKGVFNEEDEGREYRLGNAQIESDQFAQCESTAVDGTITETEIVVEVAPASNNGAQLELCYTFDYCNGNITYDPIYTLLPDKANALSLSVLFIAVAMSLLSV